MGQELSQEIFVAPLLSSIAETQPQNAAADAGVQHDELQNLVNNLVKLPEENAPPKVVKITRITHHEIKAMRETQSSLPTVKSEPVVKASAIIQTFDAFLSLFKPAEKRSRCLVEGHECKHCGQSVKGEFEKADLDKGQADKPGSAHRGH